MQQLFTSRGRCSCPLSGTAATAAGHLHISLTPLGLSGLHNPSLLYPHWAVLISKVEVAARHCVCVLLYAEPKRRRAEIYALPVLLAPLLYVGQTQTCKCKRPTRRRLSLFHLVCLAIRGFISLLRSCSISLKMSTLIVIRTLGLRVVETLSPLQQNCRLKTYPRGCPVKFGTEPCFFRHCTFC